MCSIYKILLENSLSAALSSIEIYNKPDFRYREEIFTILNINAWELLLKARILQISGDKLESIYVKDNGEVKRNRNSAPMTIGLHEAIKAVGINQPVVENINHLVEIRDSAVHLYNNKDIAYVIYTLAVASLKNYKKLMEGWFDRSLSEFNFYILPISFEYNFKTLNSIDFSCSSEEIKSIFESVIAAQSSLDNIDGFHFVCEVITQVVSSKKNPSDADFVTSIESSNDQGNEVIIRTQHLIDKYPLSYSEMINGVKKLKPNANCNRIHEIISIYNIKRNPKYSVYSFRTKQHEDEYKKNGIVPKCTTSIYNQDAVYFIASHL